MMKAHEFSPKRSASGPPGAIRYADAHSHLDFAEFDADRPRVLARLDALGFERIVVAGYSPETGERALALRSEKIRVGVGLHPWALAEAEERLDGERLEHLAGLVHRADALGEMGLDKPLARRRGVTLERQARVTAHGLRLARDHGLPLVLHVVGAHAAMQQLVDDVGPLPPMMVHAFAASAETVRDWVTRKALLSFGRAVLDPSQRRAREAAANVPLELLLVESDAPASHASSRGDPAVVVDIVREIAVLRGDSEARLAAATLANTARFFAEGSRGTAEIA